MRATSLARIQWSTGDGVSNPKLYIYKDNTLNLLPLIDIGINCYG